MIVSVWVAPFTEPNIVVVKRLPGSVIVLAGIVTVVETRAVTVVVAPLAKTVIVELAGQDEVARFN